MNQNKKNGVPQKKHLTLALGIDKWQTSALLPMTGSVLSAPYSRVRQGSKPIPYLQFVTPIHTLLTSDDSVFVVFATGHLEKLSTALLASRKKPRPGFLSPEETITYVKIVEEARLVVMLVQKEVRVEAGWGRETFCLVFVQWRGWWFCCCPFLPICQSFCFLLCLSQFPVTYMPEKWTCLLSSKAFGELSEYLKLIQSWKKKKPLKTVWMMENKEYKLLEWWQMNYKIWRNYRNW